LKTRVIFRNLGKSGWTSQQLLHALRNDTAFFKAIQTADIITCSIGGNDLIQAGRVYAKTKNKIEGERALQNFRRNFLSIDRSPLFMLPFYTKKIHCYLSTARIQTIKVIE
jgi:lysophospholipase L1-like esterase